MPRFNTFTFSSATFATEPTQVEILIGISILHALTEGEITYQLLYPYALALSYLSSTARNPFQATLSIES